MNETKKERIIRLAGSQVWDSNRCLAKAVGVTGEYVRQVFEGAGSPIWRHRNGGLLRWPCPQCGVGIARLSSGLYKHMPAHCRPCASGYCQRGHIVTPHTECLACTSMMQQRIVNYRTCVDCGEDVPVTRQLAQHIRNGYMKGKRCRPCQGKYAARSQRKTHCLRGHALTPENRYDGGGCKKCQRMRQKKYTEQRKAKR